MDPQTPQPGATAPQQTSAQSPQPKEPRIGPVSAGLMIATAVLFDLIALIPIVGGLLAGVFGYGTFAIWYKIKNVPLLGAKQLVNWGLGLLGEAASAGVLPMFTINAVATIVITNAEDRYGIDLNALTKGPAGIATIASQLPGAVNQARQERTGVTPPPRQDGTQSGPIADPRDRNERQPPLRGATPLPGNPPAPPAANDDVPKEKKMVDNIRKAA